MYTFYLFTLYNTRPLGAYNLDATISRVRGPHEKISICDYHSLARDVTIVCDFGAPL